MVKKATGRQRNVTLLVARAKVRCPVVDGYGFIDRDRARRAALDFEGLRSQVRGAAKRDRQRNWRAPVGEFEIYFRGQRVAVAADLVSLFADGLLKLVQGELALLHDRSFRAAACCAGAITEVKNTPTKAVRRKLHFSFCIIGNRSMLFSTKCCRGL